MSKQKYYKKIYNDTITLPIIPSEGVNSTDTSYYALLEKNYTPIVSQESYNNNKPDWIEGIILTTNDTYYNKLSITKVKEYDSSTYARFAKLEFYVTSPDITSDASAIEPCNKIYANIIQAPKEDVTVYIDIIPYTEYNQIYDLNTKKTILNGDKQLLKVVYSVKFNGSNIFKDNIEYKCDNDVLNNNIVSSTVKNGRCEIIYNIDENTSGKDIISNFTVNYKTKYAEYSDSITVTQEYNTYTKRLGIETFNITEISCSYEELKIDLVCEIKKNNKLVNKDNIKLVTNYNTLSNVIDYSINSITEKTLSDNGKDISVYNIEITISRNFSNVSKSIVLYATYLDTIITNEIQIKQQASTIILYVQDDLNSSTYTSDNNVTFEVSGEGTYYTINYYAMSEDVQIVQYNLIEYNNSTGINNRICHIATNKDLYTIYNNFDIVSTKVINDNTDKPYKQLKIYIPDNNVENTIQYKISFSMYKGLNTDLIIKQKAKEYTTKVDTTKSTKTIGGLKEYSKINIYCYGLIGTTHYISRNNVQVIFGENKDLVDLDSVEYAESNEYLIITYSLKDDYGIDYENNENFNTTRNIKYSVKYGTNGVRTDEVTVMQYPVFFGIDYDKYCNDQDDTNLNTISGIEQTHTLKVWGIIYNYYKDFENKHTVPLGSINAFTIMEGSSNGIFINFSTFNKAETYSTVDLDIEQNNTGVIRKEYIRLDYKVSYLTPFYFLKHKITLPPSEYINKTNLIVNQSSVQLTLHFKITINNTEYDESTTSIIINPFIENNIILTGYVTDPNGNKVDLINFKDNTILYNISATDHIVYSIEDIQVNKAECIRNITVEPTYYFSSLTLQFRYDCKIDDSNTLSSDIITLTKDVVYTGDNNNNIILDNNTYMYNVSTRQDVSANEQPVSVNPYVKYFSPDTRYTKIDNDTTHYNVSIYQQLQRIVVSDLTAEDTTISDTTITNNNQQQSTLYGIDKVNSSVFIINGNSWTLPGSNGEIGNSSLIDSINTNDLWLEIYDNNNTYLQYVKPKSTTDGVNISFKKAPYGNVTPYTLYYKIKINYNNYREKTDSSNSIVVYDRKVSKEHYITIEKGSLNLSGRIYTTNDTSYSQLGTYTNNVSTYVLYNLNNTAPDTYTNDISIYSSTLNNIRFIKFDTIISNLGYPCYIYYFKPSIYIGLNDKVHTIQVSSNTFTDQKCTLTYIQYGLTNINTNVVISVDAVPGTIDATGGTTNITATVYINGKTLEELNLKPTAAIFRFNSVTDEYGFNLQLSNVKINNSYQLTGTYTFTNNITSNTKQLNVQAQFMVTEKNSFNLLSTKTWYGNVTVTQSAASIEIYCTVDKTEIPGEGGTFTVTYYAIVNGQSSPNVTLYASTMYNNFKNTSDVIQDNKRVRTYTVSVNDSTNSKSVQFYCQYNEQVSDQKPIVTQLGSTIDVNITSSIDDNGRKVDGISSETIKLTYYGLLNGVNVTDISKVKLVQTSSDSPSVTIKNTNVDSSTNVITCDAVFPVNNTTSQITYVFTVTYSSNEECSVSKTIEFVQSVGEYQVYVETSRVVITDNTDGTKKYKYDPQNPDITVNTIGADTYNWDETTLTIYVYVLPKIDGINTNDNSNYIDIKDIQYLSMDNSGTETGMSPLKNLTLVSKSYDQSSKVAQFNYSFGKNEGVGGNQFKVSKFTVTYNSKSGITTARQLGKDQIVLAPFDFMIFDYQIINTTTNTFLPYYINTTDSYTLDVLNMQAGQDLDTITNIYANGLIDIPYNGIDTDGNNVTINVNDITAGFMQTIYQYDIDNSDIGHYGNRNPKYNPIYKQLMVFSGDNQKPTGHEFVGINLSKITNQDLLSLGITTINSDLYAHWYRARGTGKIKITYNTYVDLSSDNIGEKTSFQKIGVNINDFSYILPDDVSLVNSYTIEDSIIYDDTIKGSEYRQLGFFTHCARLTYDIQTGTGTLSKFNSPGTGAISTIYLNTSAYNVDKNKYTNQKTFTYYEQINTLTTNSSTQLVIFDITRKYSDTITIDFSNTIYKLCYKDSNNNQVLEDYKYVNDLIIYSSNGISSSLTNKKLTIQSQKIIDASYNYVVILQSPSFYKHTKMNFYININNTIN